MGLDRSAAGRAPRRALVTGGSSGIGLATALRLSAEGERVAVLARDRVGLEAARRRTAALGRECLALEADVVDPEALHAQVEAAVAAMGGLDLAVVNAGASTYGRFRDTPRADFERVLDISLRGAVDTVREVLPHLDRSGGALVVVGSVASELPLPRMAAYTAAKHGLRGFVEALRVELAQPRSPVAVSLVEPGPVDTPFWRNVASADRLLPPLIPLAYPPERVAAAIVRASRRPGRDVTVGPAWAVLRRAHRLARPLGRRLLAVALAVAERRGEHGDGRASIWGGAGAGALTSGLRRRRPRRHALAATIARRRALRRG